jgi:hypothetical protein
MPRVCTICTHEKRFEIEELLATRQGTYRNIAQRYGVSHDAIGRHAKGSHISELIALAADAERAAVGDGLLDRIEALQARTLAILGASEDTEDHRTALSAIREARRNLELIGEVTKELDRTPTLNLHLNPQYVAVRTAIVKAVEPYPEIKRAISQAMLELESGDIGGDIGNGLN